MRLDYDVHREGEQVSVRTGSVLGWCWRVCRWGIATVLLLVVIGDLAGGHVLSAGWPFLFFAIALPKRRKP